MTEEEKNKRRNDIVDAAVAWWMYFRPPGYNQDDHVNDPYVNLKFFKERELALKVAELFK